MLKIIAMLGLMGYCNTGLMGLGGKECCGMEIKRNDQQNTFMDDEMIATYPVVYCGSNSSKM